LAAVAQEARPAWRSQDSAIGPHPRIRVAMPTELDDFQALIQRVSEGSEEAARHLVEQYGDSLRRAVRRALDRRLRSKFDSLDFVQLVWSSFFRARDRAQRFANPEELVAFLIVMARNKVGIETRRRLRTEKFDIHRERSLDRIEDPDHGALVADNVTPDEVAIAREQWNNILENKDQSEDEREIVRMRLGGASCKSIAERLQWAPCTVRRLLNKLFGEASE
jgi:RNA polymerase sigma-70 factor (ECF subfamily)